MGDVQNERKDLGDFGTLQPHGHLAFLSSQFSSGLMIHSEHLFHIIFEMKTSPAKNDSSRGFSFLVGEDPWTSCGAVLGRSHFDFRGLDPRDGRSPTTRRDRWTLPSHLQGSLLLCVGGPRDWKKRLNPSQCEKQQGFSSSFMHLWFFQSFF